MAELWVTIPTNGRASLVDALAHCDPARTVLVATTEGVDPHGCHMIEDHDPVNIHRWWNAGINYAQAHGATHVAVINDDVALNPTTLPTLLDALIASDATIASPGPPRHTTDPNPNARRTLDGALWLLDLASPVRPDESYRWWYGDDDLDLQARCDRGVVTCPVSWVHVHPVEQTRARPDLQRLAEADRVRWNRERFLRRRTDTPRPPSKNLPPC